MSPAWPRLLVFQRRGVLMTAGKPARLPEARIDGDWLDRPLVDRTIEGPDGVPVRAVLVEEERSPPHGTAFRSLRTALLSLPEANGRLVGRALQIVEWDRDHRFCGRCGEATRDDPRDGSRRCPACRICFYPRVAPAVIVLVERGREALLARSPHLPEGMYSTLAGFVEPGENLEETIAREIREEVGVEVADPRYFGSQPWPFPHSLMVGFHVRWAGGEIEIDPEEIETADWFDVDDLPQIPPPLSIARHLIDDWRRRAGGGR